MNAVGKILKTEGYLGLKVSKISAVAGFDILDKNLDFENQLFKVLNELCRLLN
ncbi:hypothetical protein D3C71_2193310 [compost metagenome]